MYQGCDIPNSRLDIGDFMCDIRNSRLDMRQSKLEMRHIKSHMRQSKLDMSNIMHEILNRKPRIDDKLITKTLDYLQIKL